MNTVSFYRHFTKSNLQEILFILKPSHTLIEDYFLRMKIKRLHCSCCLFFFYLTVTLLKAVVDAASNIQEMHTTTCNTPCTSVQLTCPSGHRIALKDAAFSVYKRSVSTSCSQIYSCGGETFCCEPVPAQHESCLFSYSPSHLEALRQNCSGEPTCLLWTDRTKIESVSCPINGLPGTVSLSVLDYVCISDNVINDLCSPRETSIVGKTLFTFLDPRRWPSLEGAVCRCTAESMRYPTTNTIAVFVVDMRLNLFRQSQCSKTNVVLRSGITHRLDCESSRDSRQAFPFFALLNNSNVATVDLFLDRLMPELVWIGFESNEMEDIRLTCGLQAYMPLQESDTTAGNNSNSLMKENGTRAGAIGGGVVGGLLLCAAVIVLTLLLFRRQQKKRSESVQYSEPQDSIQATLEDVYYSLPDVTSQPQRMAPNFNKKRKNPQKMSEDTAEASKNNTFTDVCVSEEEVSDVYVNPQDIRERKREASIKRVRIISIPEISDDVEEEYASPSAIRDRRRKDADPPELPPHYKRDPTESSKDPEGNAYATLASTRREGTRKRDLDVCYDHLEIPDKVEDMHSFEDNSCETFDGGHPPESVDGNQNIAFQEDDVFE